MAVPLRNVYYLLCYAWNHIEARELVKTDVELGDRTENLLAHVLSAGVGRLTRQGLDHGYVAHERNLAGVRGKLLVGDTVKRCLIRAGRTACLVDDLTGDVPHNRVLKAAMRRLAGLDTVELELRGRLRRLLDAFALVSDIELDAAAFRSVQLHRNIARYSFLLKICRLLNDCLLPTPPSGARTFHAFTASDQAMGSLFEHFLFHFFRIEQSELDVKRRKIPWHATAENPSDLDWLPEMRTDILLSSASRRLVVEAKFYRQPLVQQLGSKQPKLHSAHLYQLLGYLGGLCDPPSPSPDGMIIYAAVDRPFDLRYTLAGHPVRAVTIDLNQPWPAIHRALLCLLAASNPDGSGRRLPAQETTNGNGGTRGRQPAQGKGDHRISSGADEGRHFVRGAP